MNEYTELTIVADPRDADRLCDILQLFDTGGIAVENPQELRDYIATSPAGFDYVEEALLQGTEATVRVYLAPDKAPGMAADIRRTVDALGAELPFYAAPRFESRDIDVESFAHAWKAYFHPTRIGERLVVRPSWEEYAPQAGDVVLTIDPGMAFGTGTHETTRLCLEALERMALTDKAVLDIGCGSGILGVAAALLGAASVDMCDLQEDAVRQARENAALNHVSCRAFQSDLLAAVTGRYDVVCANIVADVLIALLPQLGGYLRPGAVILLSGIIEPREQEVRQAAEASGLCVARDDRLNGWVLLTANNP